MIKDLKKHQAVKKFIVSHVSVKTAGNQRKIEKLKSSEKEEWTIRLTAEFSMATVKASIQ